MGGHPKGECRVLETFSMQDCGCYIKQIIKQQSVIISMFTFGDVVTPTDRPEKQFEWELSVNSK